MGRRLTAFQCWVSVTQTAGLARKPSTWTRAAKHAETLVLHLRDGGNEGNEKLKKKQKTDRLAAVVLIVFVKYYFIIDAITRRTVELQCSREAPHDDPVETST